MTSRFSPESDHEGGGGTVVLGCLDLDEAIGRFQELGFQLVAIGPADEPTWARLSTQGLRILLDGTRPAGPPVLQIADPGTVKGPLPPFVELTGQADQLVVPDTVATLEVQHESADNWIEGRAGMLYRDLIPGRYGGAYIASHIHIPDGGPVPDYVHHHDVAHQLIFCHRGWVKVVYQDQGPPFVLRPGDCVLQPPGIRHRVLEASDDLFVTEISCPAVHVTFVDNHLELPTADTAPERTFGGQRFVRHVGAEVPWNPLPGTGFEEQVTAISVATDDLAAVRLLRTAADDQPRWPLRHDDDLLFLFVVSGATTLRGPDGDTEALGEGSSVAVPSGSAHELIDTEPGTELLELRSRRPEPTASQSSSPM